MNIKRALAGLQKKKTRLFDRDKEKLEPEPRRDWNMLLGIFIAANTLVVLAGAYSFYKINSDGISVLITGAPSSGEVVNDRALFETIERYETQAQILEALLSRKPQFPDDPSR